MWHNVQLASSGRCVLIPAPYLPLLLNNTRDVMETFVNKSDVGFYSYNTSAHRPI